MNHYSEEADLSSSVIIRVHLWIVVGAYHRDTLRLPLENENLILMMI